MDFTVGKFKVEIREPYPCWVSIETELLSVRKHDGLHGIDHRDLPDLKYAVERAIQLAQQKLGTDAHEAGPVR